eukprot:6764366-Pyramimonas_sp.AAC.3
MRFLGQLLRNLHRLRPEVAARVVSYEPSAASFAELAREALLQSKLPDDDALTTFEVPPPPASLARYILLLTCLPQQTNVKN